ncbi:MAG: YtxH domain-containing protein [Bryobacteraceae bacterium]
MQESRGLSYFLVGLGVGVAVGIALAPHSGEETRGMLRSKAREGGDYLKKRGDELRVSATDLVDRGRSAVKGQKEQLSAAVDAGRQAYRDTVSSASERMTPGSQKPGAEAL